MLGWKIGWNELNIVWNAVNSTLVWMTVQLVQTAWDELTKSCSPGLPLAVVQLWLWFNSVTTQLQVLSGRSDGYLSHEQLKTSLKANITCNGPDGVDASARDGLPDVYEAISFPFCSMLERPYDIIAKKSLYNHREKFPEPEKFRFQRVRLLLLFVTLAESVTKALSIV